MPRRLLIGLLFGILSYGLAAFLHAQGLSTSAGVVLVVPIITFVGFYVGTTGAIFGSTVLLLLYAIYLLPDSPYEGVDAVTLLFGICLVYLVISLLSGRARRVTVEARDRERRQRTLRGLGDRLTGAQGVERVCHEIITTLHEHLELPAMILILDDDREKPQLVRAPKRSDDLLRTDDDVARLLAAEQELQRGSAVATATGIAYPLLAAGTLLGALVVERSDEELRSGNEEILGAVIVTTSIALEREQLAAQAMQADLFRKHEELYGALLSSISHDFRTPLSAISGAAETLAMPLADMTEEMRQELIAMIREESDRLNRFVANLLDMTKLASGRLGLRTERIDMTDVVGTAIGHLRRHDFAHTVEVDLDGDDLVLEAAFVTSDCGALLALGAECIEIFAGDAVDPERGVGAVVHRAWVDEA